MFPTVRETGRSGFAYTSTKETFGFLFKTQTDIAASDIYLLLGKRLLDLMITELSAPPCISYYDSSYWIKENSTW